MNISFNNIQHISSLQPYYNVHNYGILIKTYLHLMSLDEKETKINIDALEANILSLEIMRDELKKLLCHHNIRLII